LKISPQITKKTILNTNKNLIFELGQMHFSSENSKIKQRKNYSSQSDLSSPSKDKYFEHQYRNGKKLKFDKPKQSKIN